MVTGTLISSAVQNATMTDIATALTQSISSTGVTTPTADLPMGTKRHTGVGNATAQACYGSVTDIQNGSLVTLSAVAGTDTITANAPMTLAAYAAGQGFRFVAAGANTGAATLNVSALGAKALTKHGATALVANDIASGAVVEVVYDGTRFQMVSGFGLATVDMPTGANIASASTINLDTATGNRVHVTGTTTITAVTLTRGPRTAIFDGALTLTHHATNNNLPGGVNITTAAGDVAFYESDGTTVRCVAYTRANGRPVSQNPVSLGLLATLTPTVAANVDALTTFSSTYDNYRIVGSGVKSGTDDVLHMRFAVAGTADSGSNYYLIGSEGTSSSSAVTSLTLSASVLAAGVGCGFAFDILNANDAVNLKAVAGKAINQSAAAPVTINAFPVNGGYVAANAISGIRMYWASGANFAAVGSIRIYGYNNT